MRTMGCRGSQGGLLEKAMLELEDSQRISRSGTGKGQWRKERVRERGLTGDWSRIRSHKA
jgi:hypothetical protein